MSGKKGRSGRRSSNEERKLKDLVDITYDFLVKNFHKFTQQNMIKISLDVQKKVLPSRNENSHTFSLAQFMKDIHDKEEAEGRICGDVEEEE